MPQSLSGQEPGRVRRPLWALAVGTTIAVLMGISFSPTVSAFIARISNNTNNASAGVLTMEERNATGTIICRSTDGGGVSSNSATCSTINKFGGTSLLPGETVNTQVTITNTGTVQAALFRLVIDDWCSQRKVTANGGSATNLCHRMTIVITSGSTEIFTGTLNELSGRDSLLLPSPVPAGASVPVNFAVTLDPNANSTYQGLQASIPMTWAFNT